MNVLRAIACFVFGYILGLIYGVKQGYRRGWDDRLRKTVYEGRRPNPDADD